MIIDIAEVKEILQITGPEYDSAIEKLIPKIQDFIFTYCNNYFEVATDVIGIETSSIVFVSGSPSKIQNSDSYFVDAGFVEQMDIRVKGSLYNDGVYHLDGVTADELTLSADDSLTDEDYEAKVTITMVKYPKGIKLPVAKLIGEDLKNTFSTKEKVISEQVGNTNFNYGGSKVRGEYPAELLAGLKPWKRIAFV